MIRKVKKERINRMIWGVGVDSYNRFQTFLDNEASFDAIDEYWYAFITSYCGSDDLYPHIETIKEIVFDKFHPAYRKHMMNRKELDLFNSLPELVTLYRGMTFEERESEEFGISWSLDKKVAEFFANVYTQMMEGHKFIGVFAAGL